MQLFIIQPFPGGKKTRSFCPFCISVKTREPEIRPPRVKKGLCKSPQGNRILNSSDRQGVVDRTSGTGETGRIVGTNRTDRANRANRTNRTNRNSKTRTSKTCQADWIHLTNNPIGPIAPISPIGPIFHPLLVKRIQNAIALVIPLLQAPASGPRFRFRHRWNRICCQ